MVNALVDFIISRQGQPFLIILTAICHLFSAWFFNSHTFFMMIWSVIASKAYVNYIGIDVIEYVLQGLDTIVERFATILSRHATGAIQTVSNSLQEVGTTLTAGSFTSIATEFNKHKIGLGACASTLTKCESVSQVLEEAVKVSSLLGLETSIVNSTIGRISTMAGQAIDPMIPHGLEEMEKFIPLIASTAAMADVEFGEAQIGKHMDRFARNTKSAEVISKHIRSVAEATGLCQSANWQILQDLNTMVNNLKEDHLWIVRTLALQGSQFVAPDNYRRVQKYEQDVKKASQVLRNINIPEIKNNQIVTECNHIIMKAQDYLNQIEQIRQSIGIRPLPVGVCIFGESHIGKTEVVDQLVKRVKARLATMPELFGNANDWSKWDANQREEFDSGYCGQEIVYMDDAFQDKQNRDHLMWYTYISSSCVGTIQGVAEQKGLPFRGLLCITTANELPTKSIAVSHIAALHNRFPLTYHFKKVGKFLPWNEGGSDFKHLEIRYGSMTEFVADSPIRKSVKGIPVKTHDKFPTCDLNAMVEHIVSRMVENMTFYNLKMTTATTVPMELNAGSDDEEDFEEGYLDEIFGQIPDTSHSETMGDEEYDSDAIREALGDIPDGAHSDEVHHAMHEPQERQVTFSPIVSERVVSPAPEIVEETVDVNDPEWLAQYNIDCIRLNPVVSAGTANDATSNNPIRRAIRIDQITRAVAQDMSEALNRDQYDTIDCLGDWIEFLIDSRANKVDKSRFREEDGLYDFLASMGAWHIREADLPTFERAFVQQRIVKCVDSLGSEYLWGPAFQMGRVLYLVSPNLRTALEDAFLSGWRRRTRGWARRLYAFLTSPAVHRRFAIYTVPIAAQNLLPVHVYTSGPVLSAIWLRGFTVGFYRHGIRPFWNTNFSIRGILSNAVGLPQAPLWFVAKSFEYIETIAKRLARNMTGLLLQLLEYFGIDVSGYWQDIANIGAAMLSEVIILGIASILIYIVYRLFKLIFKKEKEEAIDMHESKNEFGKGSKKLQRLKKEKQKKLQVRGFQQRACDDFVCDKECEDGNFDIEVEDKIYTKIGICNDKESFYGCKVLEYCIDILQEDPEAKYCEFVKDLNTHIVANHTEAEDFLIQKPELKSLKRIPIVYNKEDGYGVEIRYNLVGDEEEIKTQHLDYLKRIAHLKVMDWQGEIYCRLVDGKYHLKLNLVGLTTTIQGKPRKFIQRELRDLNAIAEDIKGLKKDVKVTTEELFDHHGSDESIGLMNSLVEKHQVFMSIVDMNDVDSPEVRRMTYGIGHYDIIIFNAHVYETGEFVRFWRWNNRKTLQGYQVCHVESTDLVRDIGFARIINKERFKSILWSRGIRTQLSMMSSMVDRFRSIEPYLCDEQNWRQLADEQSTLCFLPTAPALAVGRVSIEGAKTKFIRTKDEIRTQLMDVIKISQLNMSVSLARKGDCGGLVLSYKDRYQSKILGFHCGGTASNWYAAILRKEDVRLFTQHSADDDSFRKLIVDGLPTDLPSGPQCTFLGKYKYKTKPAGDKSLAHWRYSPFHEEFEEQLQPGPLDANDSRIKIDLPRNGVGEKSLLLIPNSVMCSALPPMDGEILSKCVEHLTAEMINKIGHIKTTPDDMESLLEIALNGDRENSFCTGMELDKACGLPWNEIPGCSKKKHFLKNEDGYISFLSDVNGYRLKSRVVKKLLAAKQGERLVSLSNSKLKDAVIKISAIENAKTRVFHCIPVDKVICDAALFGNFKEAYSQAFLKLNHAIGVNPHSLQWRAIYEHLSRHPNVFDMDFSNYDKHLHSELMHGAFSIIRQVIAAKAPDEWDTARSILELESIKTYVVDYDTVYQTERGNKSGEYLTTVINCICNDILSYYTWIKTTGIDDLSEFRKNVSGVSFGDDKIESVSDEYAEKYNYFTAKEVMSSIGHIITPGAKDGIERKFCPIEQAQFLKRGIVEWENLIVAPLLQRSIESPFVWTQIETTEHEIWYNLVEQTMFEALLHGQEYYDNFRKKLGKCQDEDLRGALASLLSVDYNVAKRKYIARYYQNTAHLCTLEK